REGTRPDHLPADPRPAPEPGERRALARARPAEPVDLAGLDRRRSLPQKAFVDGAAQHGGGRATKDGGGQARDRTADGPAKGKARRRQQDGGHGSLPRDEGEARDDAARPG